MSDKNFCCPFCGSTVMITFFYPNGCKIPMKIVKCTNYCGKIGKINEAICKRCGSQRTNIFSIDDIGYITAVKCYDCYLIDRS